MPHPILLYDGVCGLCNRSVQFILRRDRNAIFRFASLQSPFAARILARHGANPADLDTVYIVVNHDLPDEQILPRSDAVIFILKRLGAAADLGSAGPDPDQRSGPTPPSAPPTAPRGLARWRFAGLILQLVPRPIRDWGYGVVARNRYRIFGRFDTCPLPSEDTRARFLHQ